MNILHIIGNGFDLNLGLKTSYRDFYDYYNSIDESASEVKKLKKSISTSYDNWSDLELELGRYTENLKTVEEFDSIFEDIGECLSRYLKKEDEKFDPSATDRERMYADLVKPENYLSVTERERITGHKGNFVSRSWNVDVFTLNYTTVIDRIIGDGVGARIGNHMHNGGVVTLRGVEHIHGYLNERMILGVNDVSQIKNQDFQKRIDVVEALVKVKCNESYGHNIDNLFKLRISQADIISIFGTSLGVTDNYWWRQIGDRMRGGNVPVLIFTKGKEVVSPRIGYKSMREKREILGSFFEKAGLSTTERELLSSSVFVGLDTEMFKSVVAS